MRRVPGNIALWLLVLIGSVSSVAVGGFMTAVEIFAPPGFFMTFDDAVEPRASAWIAFDAATGEVFAEKNANAQLPIASVTKLPAASLVFRMHDPWATTTVSWRDTAAEGRAGKLVAGEEYDLHTLMFPLLLESSNDAAAVFSRTVATLTDDMNGYSTSLGLTHTAFADTSGLSDANVSTAEELAAMLRDLYTESRHVLDITALPSYIRGEHGWINNNPFVDVPEYRGGKHGYTPAARHTAVAVFEERLRGGNTRPVGYVVLGSDNLEGDMTALREYVRDHVQYEPFLLY